MSRHKGLNLALPAAWLLLGACATAKNAGPVVWPDPPETARIRFIKAFRNTDDLRNTTFRRLLRSVMGPSTDPALQQPMGLAVSDDGQRLYIANPALGHVVMADFENDKVDYFAPEEGMGKPFTVALDGAENVYISDTASGVVMVLAKDGTKLRTIGSRLLERPTGLAIDRRLGRMYVADTSSVQSMNHRVRAFSLEGKHLFDLGPKDGPPARGGGDGEFYFPTFVALAPDGQIVVADSMNFRLEVFDTDGKFVKKYGENGDTAGFFSRIKGLAFDGFGNLYVVDGGHSNVQIFNRNFEVLMFFGGYAKRLEYFDIPSGISIDPRTNNIFICNQFIARVNQYELINTNADDSTPPKPAPDPDAEASSEH